MDKYHFIVVLLGWFYLFYLNNRTIKRAEISRLKDRMVDRLENFPVSFYEQIDRDGEFSLLRAEEVLSAGVSHMEMRASQLNDYIAGSVVPDDLFLCLRSLDVSSLALSRKAFNRQIVKEVFTIIERLEIAYDERFKGWDICSSLTRCRFALAGFFMGTIIAALYFFMIFMLYQ